MTQIPLLSHPTRFMMLDDESSFTEHVDVGLDGEFGEIELFDDTDLALNWIQTNGIVGLNAGDGIQLVDDAKEPEERLLSIQVQSLQDKTLDLNRLNMGSVVAVDYQLGGLINGVEWCRQVTNPFVQKILLTGVADERIGIEALNNGWIDQYIPKQDPDMLNQLRRAVRRARLRCFALLTQGLHFAITQAPEDTAISDPEFCKFFFKLLEDEQISEHYLFEDMGSFLLIDKNGGRRCLITQTKGKAESNLDLIEDSIEDDETRRDLETGRKIICYPSSKGFVSLDGTDYKSYLYSANVLKGQQTYYWAIVPDLLG